MQVKAIRPFSSTVSGNVEADEVIEVTDGYGQHLADHGLAEPYETKVATPKPRRRRKPKVEASEAPATDSQ